MNRDDIVTHFRAQPGYWFVPKMFGFGATPVTWQGWALTIGYVVLLAIDVNVVPEKIAQVGLGVALSAVFLVAVIRKTDGGLRWRWGADT